MQFVNHRRTALQYPLVHWTLCRCQQHGAFSMKALARYQVILLGEERHIRCDQLALGCCPNNAAVGVEPATSWSRVQRPTTTPPSHLVCGMGFSEFKWICHLAVYFAVRNCLLFVSVCQTLVRDGCKLSVQTWWTSCSLGTASCCLDSEACHCLALLSSRLALTLVARDLTLIASELYDLTAELPPPSLSCIHLAYFAILTLWRPLLPCGYSYKASCARLG